MIFYTELFITIYEKNFSGLDYMSNWLYLLVSVSVDGRNCRYEVILVANSSKLEFKRHTKCIQREKMPRKHFSTVNHWNLSADFHTIWCDSSPDSWTNLEMASHQVILFKLILINLIFYVWFFLLYILSRNCWILKQ